MNTNECVCYTNKSVQQMNCNGKELMDRYLDKVLTDSNQTCNRSVKHMKCKGKESMNQNLDNVLLGGEETCIWHNAKASKKNSVYELSSITQNKRKAVNSKDDSDEFLYDASDFSEWPDLTSVNRTTWSNDNMNPQVLPEHTNKQISARIANTVRNNQNISNSSFANAVRKITRSHQYNSTSIKKTSIHNDLNIEKSNNQTKVIEKNDSDKYNRNKYYDHHSNQITRSQHINKSMPTFFNIVDIDDTSQSSHNHRKKCKMKKGKIVTWGKVRPPNEMQYQPKKTCDAYM